ncbi:hephaestin-like 1 [Desmophyllum pertusum]|uniref:Hephaestin-like 1 n=1 Tax=Desmophyllum pertusum TaxID=174260 RepID=A0A9X0CIP0_9CNID|nr:hephaestin-like 1 [Desmophyllum pertusum]
MFIIFDESQSWYFDENIDKCTNPGDKEALKADEGFKESNEMYSINGLCFGNLVDLTMNQNEKVDWYLLGMGNEVDMHTVHFHGQTFLHKSVGYHREDVYDIFPGIFATVEMIPDSVGVWLLHCHVNDHMVHGMQTLYTVEEQAPVPASTAASTVASGLFVGLLLAAVVALY